MLVALLAIFAIAKTVYAGKAPLKLQAAEYCNHRLWEHVYEKDRLQIIEECTAVEGRVSSLHRAADGDLHIWLDPEERSVLNLVNVLHGHRKLAVEIICDHSPRDGKEQAACGDFHSPVRVPNVGDRVRVTGAYVTDRDNGWNEIHPVSRIEVLH